jgi:hypothetical protein
MLGSPEPIVEARSAIFQQLQAKEITPEAAVVLLRESEPDSPLAWAIESEILRKAGRLAEAEAPLWKTIASAPCAIGPYFVLAAIHEERDADPMDILALRLLGLWQVAHSDTVDDEIAELFDSLGEVAHTPEAYALLAERAEAALGSTPWPDKLVPYRLLASVQRQTEVGLDPDLISEILDRVPQCAPVFRAALRQWVDGEAEPLSDESASLLIALLGETAGPELIDDLIDDTQYPITESLWHGQWAVRRIAQRHPAEAFERLKAIGGKLDATGRCFVAEQLYFLPPEITGRKAAILSLLDDFPQPAVESESAAHLLLTVSTLMALMHSPMDARAVMEKHQRRLPKDGREWLDEALGEEQEWLPLLIMRGIDELTVEQVCTDLALLPVNDDDGPDEDFDDDYVEPVVAPPKPGRNEPCWCGSGKKYKKCHLTADEEERSAASGGIGELAKVLDDIMETVLKKMSRADAMDAYRLFFNCEADLLDLDPEAETAFLAWMVMDFRPASTGRTAVEEYLRRRGPRLPENERALVEAFRDARYGLWEIQRVEKGRGIEVKDYFGDECLFVSDKSSSRQAVQWDCVIGYFIRREDHWEFFSDGVRVPRNLVRVLADQVEAGSREAGVSASDYFRTKSHQWRRAAEEAGRAWRDNLRIANSEGDPLEFSSAAYEVLDAAAAESALVAVKAFEPAGPGVVKWREYGAESSHTVYGSIEIRDGRLRLDCNSRKRLAIGRQLVEKHAGAFLRHIEDTYKSLDEIEAPDDGPDLGGLTPEIEREIVLSYKAKHYAGWPDEPLPALGGRTPRQAVRSISGRRAVEELLRDFENSEERERLEGRPAFDFGILRRDLGLAEPRP